MKPLNKYIDHTNLKPFATPQDIIALCAQAAKYDFMSVCVNPVNVSLAKKLLKNTTVLVCTVIGFPLGQNTTEVKVFEAENAYKNGCDEFDMVINVGALKAGDREYVKNEIAAVVAAVNGKTVKVIIETGLLTKGEIALATQLACSAGADFVKTCTGCSTGSATVEAVEIMKDNLSNGAKIKASGGIKSLDTAKALIDAGAERLGTSSGVEIVEQ